MLYYRSPLSVGSFAKDNITQAGRPERQEDGWCADRRRLQVVPRLRQAHLVNADSIQWQFGDLRLREALLLKGDVDAILGFNSTMYFNFVRQGIAPSDIKFLYYSDAGLNIYGNAILASKKILESNPEGGSRLRRRDGEGLARCDRRSRRRDRCAEEALEPGRREARNRPSCMADQEPARDRRIEGRWPWRRPCRTARDVARNRLQAFELAEDHRRRRRSSPPTILPDAAVRKLP